MRDKEIKRFVEKREGNKKSSLYLISKALGLDLLESRLCREKEITIIPPFSSHEPSYRSISFSTSIAGSNSGRPFPILPF